MDVTQPIARSFADEHVIGTDPPMRPELSAHWRRRINAFAGRAISDKALTAEQDLRSGMQRLYGLALQSGIADGLVVRAESGTNGQPAERAFITISPGAGIARSGEDISIGRTVRLPLGDVQVVMRVDHAAALSDDAVTLLSDAAPGGEGETASGLADRLRPERPRGLSDPLKVIAANPESAALPHIAVLVAQPIVAEIQGRPGDSCPPDPRDDPYVDLQRIDGARLLLYLWPAEMLSLDGGADYALPAPGPARRNRLAYSIFETERLHAPDEAHPWEAWGVPLALIGFTPDWQLEWIDRHAVARIGGTPRERSSCAPEAGDARLWQARIDQFTAQLAELPSYDAQTLRQTFAQLPPVGVLPPGLFDTATRRQFFFPTGYKVDAVPVATSNLNLVVAECASLAPLDAGQGDAVQLLVPVPDAVYEPGLLRVAREDRRIGEAIRTMREDRTRWLVRRQMARRRYDRLLETVSGAVMGWPSSDLPHEENTPAPYVQTPVEVTRTRRVAAGSAVSRHLMAGADATLTVSASDTIWFWVRIIDDTGLTGLSLRLDRTWGDGPINRKGVFWGSADGLPVAEGPGRLGERKIGELPSSGGWVRLEVPASAVWDENGGTLDGFAIDYAEFSQHGGTVEWAAMGKLDVGGLVYTYIADDAPAGARLTSDAIGGEGWPWQAVAGRDEMTVPDFGTVLVKDVRHAAALDGFRDRWKQDFLRQDLETIDESGIVTFLASVDARLKATNDAIDLGFVRARADIYRVRQIMLGADAASRLVTSPAIADLALRDEGARATSKGIADFLTAAITRKPGDAVIRVGEVPGSPPPPPPPPPPAGTISPFVIGRFQPSFMTLNIASVVRTPPPPPPPAPMAFASFLPISTFMVQPAFSALAAPAAAASPARTATVAPLFQAAQLAPMISLDAVALSRSRDRFRSFDIQMQTPIAGLIERTASVAERLKPQPAVQALQFALASKAAVIGTLAGLAGQGSARPGGIALGDVQMAGFHNKNTGEVPTLSTLLGDPNRTLFVDSDVLPDSDKTKHEADYFTAAVQAIDNTIAIMRLVEGRVALFEELAASLRDLTETLRAAANEAAAYMRSVDVEVAEARHDLATAERLREEDRALAEATNARRAAIIETHVNAIVWRRVRAVDVRDEVPMIEAASGLAPSAIAVCRREHEEAPDEIHDYVQLLREVPVSWFPAIAAMVGRIERLESAQAALRTAIERAITPRMLAAPYAVSAQSRYLAGVQNALVAGRKVVETRRLAVAQFDMLRIAALSLAETQAHLTQASTIGDLVTGTHRQPALTKAALDEIDAITAIAGCLHESFGEVSPVVRLGWAEILSAFDQPAPLQNLAGLPGWGEVPVEQRRDLQGFVDWLFARIDRGNQGAHDAINELVRVCLLMAAHAPVDKIIPAHLVAPVPAKIGTRLLLALDVTRVRKGMTTLIRNERDQIVSHAIVEEISAGRVQASITKILAPITTVTSAMRFQMVAGMVR
ncbi:hypothetical protein [Novosphingobium sp.]|uniref:hypothetical protein n=1 Tax=Novosphingobium sp. TaxID=1874826 RepID=UPI00286D0D0C|nr:hypothetical protein [Novosphingobium sp.]